MMTAEFRVRQSPVRLQSMLADAPSVLHPVPPEWVTRLVDTSKTNDTDPQTGRDRQLSLLQARIDHAVQMNGDELRQVVAQRYADLGRRLAAIERKAVRMWNFMPDPTARLDGGRDRYMAFNQGRGDGYRHWPASVRGGGTQLPTASAVGIPGTDLIIFCLSSTEGGVPVENPRQTPAWRYSTRYGPTPPSFARATATTIAGQRLLLIGGTASVVGEDTACTGDIDGQLDQTFENLTALIATACPAARADAPTRLVDARVYLTRADDAALVRERLAMMWPRLTHVELTMAPLCRQDLLVEIEGVAELSPPA